MLGGTGRRVNRQQAVDDRLAALGAQPAVGSGMNNSQGAGRRSCPLCGGGERRLLFRREVWEVVECARCAMVFVGNDLAYHTQIQEHDWMDGYRKEHERPKCKHPVLLFISSLTRRLKPKLADRLLAQTLRWRQEGKLLDFGRGDASFLERAAEKFEAMGVEISPRLAEMARKRMPAARILEGPATEVALPAMSMDVVTQFGYLEHEWRPLAALRAAHGALRPGGVTLIKVPNYASWNRRVMGTDWCGYHLPDHCNYFTPRTLRAMLQKENFTPLPGSFLDRLPTSDTLYMAAQKPA